MENSPSLPPQDGDAGLAAKFRFKEERRRVAALKEAVLACPRWTPGAGLATALDETLADIDALEERLGSKAVVALVGGSGTGKSSLVNALCGRKDAVLPGLDRPTTRRALAVVRALDDAHGLLGRLQPGDLDVVQVPETALPDAVLVDTPDTDSAECRSYAGTLDRVLANSDVLVCVFEAANPKRKDNLDFLSRHVAKFAGRHVLVVLNHADRVPAGRLAGEIVPDFLRHLESCWTVLPEKVFLTCATGACPDGAENGLASLVARLRTATGRDFADERVARAAFLRACAEKAVHDAVARHGDWKRLAADVRSFEKTLSERVVRERHPRGADGGESLSAALLKAVTPRWWGPVGTFLGFSSRMRSFAAVPFRPSDLVLPLGVARRVKAFAGAGAEARGETPRDEPESAIPHVLDVASADDYAALAERMTTSFGMDAALRDPAAAIDFAALEAHVGRAWSAARDDAVAAAARRCSGFFLQAFANALVVVPAGYVFWIAATTFLRAEYLPTAFYRQALLLLAFAWLAAGWLVQLRLDAAARLLPGRIAKRLAADAAVAGIVPAVSEMDRLGALAAVLESPHGSKTGES